MRQQELYKFRESCFVKGSPDYHYLQGLLKRNLLEKYLGTSPKEAKPGDILVVLFKEPERYQENGYDRFQLMSVFQHENKDGIHYHSIMPPGDVRSVSYLREDLVRCLDPELTKLLRPICPYLPHLLTPINSAPTTPL